MNLTRDEWLEMWAYVKELEDWTEEGPHTECEEWNCPTKKIIVYFKNKIQKVVGQLE